MSGTNRCRRRHSLEPGYGQTDLEHGVTTIIRPRARRSGEPIDKDRFRDVIRVARPRKRHVRLDPGFHRVSNFEKIPNVEETAKATVAPKIRCGLTREQERRVPSRSKIVYEWIVHPFGDFVAQRIRILGEDSGQVQVWKVIGASGRIPSSNKT